MLFENIKKTHIKYFLWITLALTLITSLCFFTFNSINTVSKNNQNIFGYIVRVRDTVEALDRIFELAEINLNIMADSISNSYDTSKQQDKVYNLHFVEKIDTLVRSVLTNSPNVDGAWFQLNANLPFSASAYNWYEFRNNQFIDMRDQITGTSAVNRKITPQDDPYYFDAIENQKTIWSDIYIDADTKIAMMTISSPVYKDGTLVGVVGIDISISNLQQILTYMQTVLGNVDVYLLNQENNVVLTQLLSSQNASEKNYPFLSLFNKYDNGPIEYYDNHIKKTAIRFRLSNDYKIIIAVENKFLFSGTNQLIWIIFILYTLLIISTVIALKNWFKTREADQADQADQAEIDTNAEST